MAILSETHYDESVVTAYDSNYMVAATVDRVWDQFAVSRKKAIEGFPGNTGKTLSWNIFEVPAPATTALTATMDVEAGTNTENATTVTAYEYGYPMILPRFLNLTSFQDLMAECGEVLGIQFRETNELLARYPLINGNRVYRPLGCARSDIDYTNDAHLLSADFLDKLHAHAESLRCPTFPGGVYATVLHPSAIAQLRADSLWENYAVYADSSMIRQTELTSGRGSFDGEVGMIGGFRICKSQFGKVYWSGGKVAQTATTLNGAVAAGATSIILTSGTGVAEGDWITLGTLNTANSEQVQITSDASTPTFTIEGFGNTEGNRGLKFDHATLSAATEATQVAAVPVIGPKSLAKIYSEFTTEAGRHRVQPAPTNIPDRFDVLSWLLWAGWGRIADRYIIRGEAAIASKCAGYVEALA